MKAMILAAGYGTRMKKLSKKTPKALITVDGMPLLYIVLQQLEQAGFDEIAVNAHYHAAQIQQFLENYSKKSGIRIHCSLEEHILNTGGGIKKMLDFFTDADDDPVLVQNVDILCDMDYSHLFSYHVEKNAEATLAINKRRTDRPLCVDEEMNFKGRGKSDSPGKWMNYGFCGIQVVRPSLFREIDADIFYSIDVYIDAARRGKRIIGYDIKNRYWRDIGRPEDVEHACLDIQNGMLQLP